MTKDVDFSLDLSLSVSLPGELDQLRLFTHVTHDLISTEFLLQTSLPNENKEYTKVSTMTKTLLFSEYYVQ